jgi:hypothetical protein
MQYSSSLIFDPSEDTAIHWAARTGLEHALDLRTAEQLYARALPYLKTWAWALATKHGWTQEAVDNVGDMPLAVCLGRDELLQGVDGDLSYVARLVLPLNFSDFLNPEFTHDWAVMFSHLTTSHSTANSTDYSADIFQLGRAGIPRPLQNILYLLQILSPGLLLVRSVASDDEDDDGQWGAQGIDLVALPPSIWVGLHIEDLEDIFGAQAALKLYQAAEDPYCASEDASSAGSSYRSFDATSDFYYSDSSAGLTSDDYSEDDWAAVTDFDDLPEFEQDDTFVQYDPSQEVDHQHFIQAPAALDDFASRELEYNVKEDHHHHNYFGQQEPPLISDPDVGKASNIMEGYRHCDSDCAYCGLCSRRFAESLTQRLLMHGAIFAI